MLRRMELAPRSAVSFGIITFIVFMLGGFSLYQIEKMSAQSVVISDRWLPNIVSLSELVKVQLQTHVLMTQVVAENDPQKREMQLKFVEMLRGRIASLKEELGPRLVGVRESQVWEKFVDLERDYSAEQLSILALARGDDQAAAVIRAKGRITGLGVELSRASDDLMKLNMSGYTSASDALQKARNYARTVVLVSLVCSVLLTILLAVFYTRSIVVPLSHAVSILRSITQGDLKRPIEKAGRDEPARLLASLADMQDNLRNILERIMESSHMISSSSNQIDVVAEDSLDQMQRQNAVVERANHAISRASASIGEVASNASWTASASLRSESIVRMGCEHVGEMVESITHLSDGIDNTSAQVNDLVDSASSVAQILEVIRSITEQTNLLALNAAIEAARAGDVGRGFAVVADEVRALAHRTQNATKQIQDVIVGVQDVANRAVDSMLRSTTSAQITLGLAREADLTLNEIQNSIEQISKRNIDISSSADQLTEIMQAVADCVAGINDSFHAVYGCVGKTRQASGELSQSSSVLHGIVSRFDV